MIDYLNLEDVAVQRGEKSDLLARKLVANGSYLYLWFDNNRIHKAMMLFPGVSKKEMDYEFDQGTYPLTQGSREALIKILNRGENTTEGLEILIESDDGFKGFKGFVTYQVRLTEEDDSVCVVVNPDDVEKLPPPSTYQTAPGSMYPTPPEKKIIENFEGKNSSKRKGEKEDHTLIIWEAMQSLDNDLKKEAKPTMIWNYLRKNINKYNTNGVIISISHDVMTYFESNATEGLLTKESFRHAIKRLRENPPK